MRIVGSFSDGSRRAWGRQALRWGLALSVCALLGWGVREAVLVRHVAPLPAEDLAKLVTEVCA